MNHGALEQNCTSAGFTIRSVMAAALWVAIKFVGPRAVLPGTSFMVTALGKSLHIALLWMLDCPVIEPVVF